MDRVAAVRTALTEDLGLAEIAAPGCERHGSIGMGVLRRTFFPDLVVSVAEAFSAEGDRVVAVLELAARGVRWEALVVARFEGDAVVEVRTMADDLAWLRVLGVVPDETALERALDAVLAETDPERFGT